MSEIAQSDLAPYLNPAYWNGYSLGYGDVETNTPRSTTYIGRMIAYLSVQDHVVSKRGILEGVTLQPGDIFDAQDHPKGTVVLFQWEDIHTHGKVDPISPEDYKGVPVPARPFLNQELSILDEERLRHYSTAPFLGAVGAGMIRRRHSLYGTPAIC